MSLLLDALKKAEQAKREKAAEAAKGGGAPAEDHAATGAELRLEPLPDELAEGGGSSAGSLERPGGMAGEVLEAPGPVEGGGSSTLRLELDESLRGGRPRREVDLEEFSRKLAESAGPMGDTGGHGPLDLREATATGAHTMPSLKNVQSALRDFYGDASRSGDTGRGAAAPPSNGRPGAAPGDTQPSRKAARNVFDAKQRQAVRPRSAWALLGATAVLLAILLVGGYYAAMSFITVQPSTLAVSRPAGAPPRPAQVPPSRAVQPASPSPAAEPAPVVAGVSAGPSPVAPAAAPATEPGTAASAPGPAAAVPAQTPPVQTAAAPAPATPPAPGAATPGAPSRAVPAALAPTAAGPATPGTAPRTAAPGPSPAAAAPSPPVPPPATRPAAGGRPATEEEAYRLALAPRPKPSAAEPRRAEPAPPPAAPAGAAAPPSAASSAPPPAPRAGRSPIRVAAQAGPDPTFTTLDRAYQAFQEGSHGEARRLYLQVLSRDPRNRDALLGIGAVSVAEGQTDQAQAAYRRILAQNPQDRIATAALTSLRGGGDLPQTESRLQQLLQQDPTAPYLHFALGNLYASQRRWREAQQAYFDAYRGDSGNADYAYNLAVSLDNLTQRRTALDYYRRALDLRGGSFDAAALRERVERLEGAVNGPGG